MSLIVLQPTGWITQYMDPDQEHSETGVIISGSRINNLKFADDVDLIDKDEIGLQQQVVSLHDNSERYYCEHSVSCN